MRVLAETRKIDHNKHNKHFVNGRFIKGHAPLVPIGNSFFDLSTARRTEILSLINKNKGEIL